MKRTIAIGCLLFVAGCSSSSAGTSGSSGSGSTASSGTSGGASSAGTSSTSGSTGGSSGSSTSTGASGSGSNSSGSSSGSGSTGGSSGSSSSGSGSSGSTGAAACTFHAPVMYAPAISPDTLAIADLDGDGRPDVLARAASTQVVLFGLADAGLDARPATSASGTPTVYDVDGDGLPDLVVGDGVSGVNFMKGYGDGGFAPPVSSPGGGGSLVVGDFDGDTKPDVVVADGSDAGARFLKGDGQGHFTPGASVALAGGYGIYGMVTADFNQDYKLDVAATPVTVSLGNGDGTFQPTATYAAGQYPLAIHAADVNGDGYPDLVVSNEYANYFSVFLANPDGTFQPQIKCLASDAFPSVGDLDGDGRAEMFFLTTDALQIFDLDASGACVGRTVSLPGVVSGPAEVADLGNGQLDLVIGQPSNSFYAGVGVILQTCP